MTVTNGLAPTPPLGWNSWDCYGPSVRENEVKANAEFMAEHLAQFGWSYVVVDIQWYEPNAQAGGYRPNADLIMDDYGRLMPAVNRFPSAAGGMGFKPLADYVHKLGLQFGLHILRGIPRQAVERNLPILDTPYCAQDIADKARVSSWIDDMYGIDMTKPGAQEYYDSIVKLYASWDVDYIKADDMLWPYHESEIAALHAAIAKLARPMLLSLSPGVEMTPDRFNHLKDHCELFRISADFWDRWEDLKAQFDVCRLWAHYTGPGCWADADMLPLGHIGIRAERGIDRQTLLTRDEQMTLMTLWTISRSPLMFGGDLPTSDDFTLSLLTNAEVLQVLRASTSNHQFFCEASLVGWRANSTESDDLYLAMFNLGDEPQNSIVFDFTWSSGERGYHVRDLWEQTELGFMLYKFQLSLAPHACKFYRLYRF